MAKKNVSSRKKASIRQIETVGAVFTVVVGSILHFAYEWSGNNVIVWLVAAINESVWEHTKLLATPVLLFAAFEAWRFGFTARLLKAKLYELLVGIGIIIGFYYTYTGALGIGSLAIDIGSVVAAAAIGKHVSFRVLSEGGRLKKNMAFVYGCGIVLICALFVWATFAPPRIPLFKDAPTGTYGISRSG